MKFTKKFKENAALVVLGVVLFWGLTNYDKFFRLLGVMIGVLKPVIFGCIRSLKKRNMPKLWKR